jgi:hypothetical protein
VLGLTAREAERDFLRQVKPAQRVRPVEGRSVGQVLHARLLVNSQGKVVDWEASCLSRAQAEAASQSILGWTFRPAHWGSLPVASYVNVEVPLSSASLERTSSNSVGP